MPGKNGTGPMGAGPMPGRGFGNCAGRRQGAAGQGFGRGLGQGGNGRGRGRMLQAGAMQGGRRFGFNRPHQASDAAMENQEIVKQNETLQSELRSPDNGQ